MSELTQKQKEALLLLYNEYENGVDFWIDKTMECWVPNMHVSLLKLQKAGYAYNLADDTEGLPERDKVDLWRITLKGIAEVRLDKSDFCV